MNAYSASRSAVDGVEVVQLADGEHSTEISIAPALGNITYEFKVDGKNILWFPYRTLAEQKARPQLGGIPFLAPWANRLEDDAYWANGKQYRLNPALGNVRRDGHQKPIHGFLSFSADWKVVEVKADDTGAWAVSRLEFWKRPEMMEQFPFAHTITMTHRLRHGELEVETAIENHSTDPMPVAIGFHPFFHLNDVPRDAWKAHIAARDHMLLSDMLIPTGERKPMEFSESQPLRGIHLDDVFTNLIREPDGRARFWVEGIVQRINVSFGPKYTVAVVYAPAGREYICFEPMAAITNAFNMAHSGLYKELQSVPPGGSWVESFWVGTASV